MQFFLGKRLLSFLTIYSFFLGDEARPLHYGIVVKDDRLSRKAKH